MVVGIVDAHTIGTGMFTHDIHDAVVSLFAAQSRCHSRMTCCRSPEQCQPEPCGRWHICAHQRKCRQKHQRPYRFDNPLFSCTQGKRRVTDFSPQPGNNYFLRPFAASASRTFWSSHEFMEVRSRILFSGKRPVVRGRCCRKNHRFLRWLWWWEY